MQVSRNEILSQLEALRKEQGEDAYIKARRNFALMLLPTAGGEAFLKETFPDLDLEPLRSEASRQPQMKDFIDLIKTHVPSITNQTQFDLFMSSFNALTMSLDNYFSGNQELGDQARDALIKTVEMAKRVRGLGEKVSEIPPEERSPEAAAFMDPPKQFTEVDEQRRLLAELDAIQNSKALATWYATERKRIDGVVTKPYRDALFDAIRQKKSSLLS